MMSIWANVVCLESERPTTVDFSPTDGRFFGARRELRCSNTSAVRLAQSPAEGS